MSVMADAAGFIANTDFGWFSHFLHRAEPPDEVDFWQPSPHGFKAIPPGAPFFFRLGAPHKAIAGFGFFARYERVPVWLAWGRWLRRDDGAHRGDPPPHGQRPPRPSPGLRGRLHHDLAAGRLRSR